jgi:hypothetical protein
MPDYNILPIHKSKMKKKKKGPYSVFRLYVPEYCVAPGNGLNYVLVNHTHIAEMD